MATQKQKRARLEQKRRDELAATIQSGLRAQEKDREQRALRAQAVKEKAEVESRRQLSVIASAKMAGMAGMATEHGCD